MPDFKNIRVTVKHFLTVDKLSRCSDIYLYALCVENAKVPALTTREHRTLTRLLKKAHFSLPSFATVMRARQKIQSESPELAEKHSKAIRAELERQYREEFRKH